MSLDPVRTLDPSSGLVSEASVYVPNDVGLWRTVGVLAQARASQPGFASAVGAFDVNKRASLTRGAGEAVERFALVPAQTDDEHFRARPGSEEQRLDFVTAGLGRASALAFDFPWYRATDLLTQKTTYVPAPLVDYHPGLARLNPWDAFFDPSPNGAASGPSESFAQAAGIAEVLERDAFLSAWRNRTPLHLFDVAGLQEAPGNRSLVALLATARAAGVEPTLAFVPQRGGPLETAVCIITNPSGPKPFGAVGLKASPDPVAALRGALQEGLQIRELFLARTQAAVPVLAVTDDESRAEFWTTEPAIYELLQWVSTFTPSPMPARQPAASVDALVNHLEGRDIPTLWVSLTHRLPVPIRDMGWVAGKAICPGTVPLSMDETKGVSVTASTPHPLI
ncbi:YcaO-like family protein [Paenarthrobacter sp. GOM3]|uniref:YcaO-like family protein n=1 Tax=Paenarthrobacter sp. GOM3 TaxID=2782567 RepID=UPI001BA91C53|nr:YcaO-like family protein [Paenarthrobacter sp. GOM3]WOH18067.1 YcaO-like family protein [Paenarthrobacter sp. GOM3]